MTTVKSHFTADNFVERRANSIGAGNAFDPDSLITGWEIAHGFTYTNSHRDYPGQATYDAIVAGQVPVDQVPLIAPRVFNAVPLTDPSRDAYAADVRQGQFSDSFAAWKHAPKYASDWLEERSI